MKKSIKRVASVFATVTMLAVSAVPAFAEYPTDQASLVYSEQELIAQNKADFARFGTNGLTAAPNAEDVFTVDGKSFVLIDKNANGDYFVTTKEPIAKDQAFYTGDSNSIVTNLVTATKNGDGSYTFTTNYEDNSYVNNNWMYSATDENSIGYKVNANLSTKDAAGIGGYKLPDAVIDNLVETEWGVEGTEPIAYERNAANPFTSLSGGADYSFDNLRNIEGATTEGYTVTAKVALPSYTEYKTYWDKLGFENSYNVGDTRWKYQLLTRTSHKTFRVTTNTADSKILVARMGSLLVDNTRIDGHVVAHHNDSYYNNAAYRIRPVFFLDKDFFGKVPIDLSTAGSAVKAEIQAEGVKLFEIYDSQELHDTFGMNITDYPTVENIIISGQAAVGSLLICDYDYVANNANPNEGATEISWYIVDGDTKTQIEGENGLSLIIPAEASGKTIEVKITPKDQSGKTGVTSYKQRIVSDKTQPINVKTVISVGVDSGTGLGVASVTVSNTTAAPINVRFMASVFNSEGIIIGDIIEGTSTQIPAENQGTPTISGIPTAPSGGRVQIMLWDEMGRPIMFTEQ